MNFGTCSPVSRGMIMSSISKLTIAAGSAPSPSLGTFISIGIVSPGCDTRHSVDMPPR